MEHGSWLTGPLVYLAAAVLAVPLAKFFGLGSIIGYLGAGILIGPWGLKLVTNPQEMLSFSEFGVVLMLFLVGLELEPKRLWQLRKPIFGWGSVQLFGSAALMVGVAMACGLDWRIALVAALGLAMSSTAIGLGVLNERSLMNTASGQSVLSVVLAMSGSASTQTGLVMFIGIIHKRRRSGGTSGRRSVMCLRSAATNLPLKPLGNSKMCSAPTCIGVSGVSRCRKVASRPDRRFIRSMLGARSLCRFAC